MKQITYNIRMVDEKHEVISKEIKGYLIKVNGLCFGVDHRSQFSGWYITELQSGFKIAAVGRLKYAYDEIMRYIPEIEARLSEMRENDTLFVVNDISKY